jgi:hypothetical protein
MDSNIKSLTITGVAAEDATKSRRQNGSRRRRTELTESAEEEKEFIENAKRLVISKNTNKQPVQPVQHIQPTTITQSPVRVIQPVVPLQIAQPIEPVVHQEGGKVILKPHKSMRVKLQPKGLVVRSAVTPVSSHTNQTRKARKICLTVANLNHRFTRAKRVKDDTDKKPMVNIRDFLIQKGVIQEKSKAPEKMLRSMYSDFMLLKDQAL